MKLTANEAGQKLRKALSSLSEVKPLSRESTQLLALQYNLKFKWYHTTNYIRLCIKYNMTDIPLYGPASKFLTYKKYIWNETKYFFERLLLKLKQGLR